MNNITNIKKDFAYAPLVAVLNLGEGEKKVWLTLFTFQGQNEYCFPSLEAIRKRMANCMSTSRISRITSQLVKKGWLEKWRKGRRNQYRVLFPQDMLFVPDFGSLSTQSENAKSNSNKSLYSKTDKSNKQGSLNLETKKQSVFRLEKESEPEIDFDPRDYRIHGAGRFGSYYLKKYPNQDDSYWEQKYGKEWVEYGRSLGLSPDNYEGFIKIHEVESYEEYLIKSGEMTREEIDAKEEEYHNGKKLQQVA